MRKIIFVTLIFITANFTQAQGEELTQTVRGKVVDKETQTPLIGSTILRLGGELTSAAISDTEGNFFLYKVPVGRHDFQVSFVGYETFVINEMLVGSGKELVLNIELTESVTKLDEVVVKANTKKDQPLNDMATVSARVFSVEEAKRYAGGFDDPARLASAFAGVVSSTIESNAISVRGNAPSMLQYRMEGIEVDNANHFDDGNVLGGGFVSIFNSNVLANSDFLTGAFPAEYGNALSAAFDMKMRTGNTQKHEHTFQMGVMGIEAVTEGPLRKGKNASYLINYRYSTFGLIQNFLPEGEGLPVYQDLNFKFHLPTKKYGVFSLWGAGAIDEFDRAAKEDPSEWNMKDKRRSNEGDFKPAIVGLNHKMVLKNQAYVNSTIAYNYFTSTKLGQWLHDDMELYDLYKSENTNTSLTFSTFINKKFNAKHTNRTGISYKLMDYKYDAWAAPRATQPLQQKANSIGNGSLFRAYSQSKISLNPGLYLNAGIHYQLFTLNNKFSLEPRLGLKQRISNKAHISAAYGMHSRTQPLNHYFITSSESDVENYINQDLDFTRAHHFVFGFDYSISKNTRLKIEPYYQILSSIPVIADSSFATINLKNDHEFSGDLVSEGTGHNIGIEFTLERFLERGFYYLLTTSLYDSKYTGGDNVERNTRYNGNYIVNLLGGKEWSLGKNKNSILGINGRLYVVGGDRHSPVDYEQSFLEKDVVYDNTRLYEDKNPTTTRLDISLSLTHNRPKYSSTLSIQVLNALGTAITYNQDYDFVEDKVVDIIGKNAMPNISLRIDF